MLTIPAGSRHTLRVCEVRRSRFDRGEVNLLLSIPGSGHAVGSLNERHAAHRAGWDLPFVGEDPLETLALVVRNEEGYVPVDTRGGRAVKQVDRTLAVCESACGTAGAGPRGFRPGRCFLGKGLAFVCRMGHPQTPVVLTALTAILESMPGHIN